MGNVECGEWGMWEWGMWEWGMWDIRPPIPPCTLHPAPCPPCLLSPPYSLLPTPYSPLLPKLQLFYTLHLALRKVSDGRGLNGRGFGQIDD